MTTTVVITGFGPFAGVGVNPAQAGVLDAGMSVYTDPGIELIVEILPVEFQRARQRVRRLAASARPDLWIGFGVAVDRTVVTPELWGRNVVDARVPDNAGAQPCGEPVDPDGPDALAATLVVAPLLDALRAAGFAAEPSESAGRFVCNAVLYTALRALADTDASVGFVHLPLGIERPDAAVRAVVRAAVSHLSGR